MKKKKIIGSFVFFTSSLLKPCALSHNIGISENAKVKFPTFILSTFVNQIIFKEMLKDGEGIKTQPLNSKLHVFTCSISNIPVKVWNKTSFYHFV